MNKQTRSRVQNSLHAVAALPLVVVTVTAILTLLGPATALDFLDVSAILTDASQLAFTLMLACTPLTILFGWQWTQPLKRPLGLYAFMYGTLHFLLFSSAFDFAGGDADAIINGSACTYLVVDDDPTIVRILRGYLEQASYQVRSAHNGKRALQAIHSQKPDLLVLDLMLPDRDGWDLTRELRSSSRYSAMPIIMLTARVDDSDKIIGLELGADDYITKPVNNPSLTLTSRPGGGKLIGSDVYRTGSRYDTC